MALQKPPGDPKEAEADDQTGNSIASPRSEQKPNRVADMVDMFFGTNEITFEQSSFVPETFYKPYNPDPLVQKNQTYKVYTDMVYDDQVSVALQLKKDLVLAAGFDFIVEDDNPLSVEMKEFLKVAFDEDPEIPFEESLEDILTAYEYGFSISEKIFKDRSDGMLTLRCVKTRHPATWLIHTDERGNVYRYEQRTKNSSIDVNPKALIHYLNNRRFQNPYGNSDLRSAYAAYFIKQEIVKFYAIFMEKAASPVPVARYDKDAPQQAVADIFNTIKKFQTKSAIAIPKQMEVEFIEAKNNGEVFEKAINIFNMFIGRALMIPDLLGFQGGETSGGSFSLGKNQMDILFKHIHKRRCSLEKVINAEIVWPMIVYNFGFQENYPKFRLKPIQDDQLIELAKLWLDGAKSKVWKPSDEEINHFRSLAKFPEGDVERDAPLPNPLDPNAPMGSPGGFDPEGKPLPPPKDQKDKEKPVEKDPEAAASKKPIEKPEEYKSKPELQYAKKTDFKMIGRSMSSFQDSVLNEVLPVTRRSINDLIDQIKRKKIIALNKPDKIQTLKVKYLSEISGILRRNFKEAYLEAQKIAKSELEKGANYISELKIIKFAQPPLQNDEFMEVLESESLAFIGDWEYTIKKKVRLEIIKAIKDGLPVSDVEGVLDDVGNELTEEQMERYSRTKFTEVMNRGRLDYFDSSGVVEAYQYSAVLDDRTSEICAGLDNKIFEAGDQPIPPMHFNCRSILVPITKYEEYEVDKSANNGQNIDKFIEQNKGEGFPRYSKKQSNHRINDPGVELVIEHPEPHIEVCKYSMDGELFQITTAKYSNERRDQLLSVKHRRV